MKKLTILTAALATALMLQVPTIQDALADGHGGKERGHQKRPKKGKMFKAADSNGDDVISKSEFKDHHEKKMDEWFSKLDQDGNGEVTEEEAREGRKHMREKMKARAEKRQEKRQERQDSQ